MRFVIVIAAFFASAILVMPTVSQAQESAYAVLPHAAAGAVNCAEA
jgi:hypothetical protein